MRKTKIVCTIGPATAGAEQLRALVDAGMDVARLNFSHGAHEWHRAVVTRLRQVAADAGRPVAILQDLGGPKVRAAALSADPLDVTLGQDVLINPEGTPEDSTDGAAWIRLSVPGIAQDLGAGDRVLLSDGAVELTVAAVSGTAARCAVTRAGRIRHRSGTNFPDTGLSLPSLTEKDLADLALGVELGVDWVALSFVRRREDIEELRARLATLRAEIPIIAKIEKPQALADLAGILDETDGVMVARGDLGVETALENVPLAQKRIIAEALRRSKPVITATQMLESMVEAAAPTRAEVADVANAILDGTDAVMLSAETSIGAFPLEACTVMDRVCRAVECERPRAHPDIQAPDDPTDDAVADATASMAASLDATAILACTMSGLTARLVSSHRPCCPILALTSDPRTLQRLPLLWGVYAAFMPVATDTDTLIENAKVIARERGFIQEGRRYVGTAGHPAGVSGRTNLLRVGRG